MVKIVSCPEGGQGLVSSPWLRCCCVAPCGFVFPSFFQPVYLDKVPPEPFKMDEPAPLIEDR